MNVLSLFDGLSCGQIALERAGFKVDNYYASEIDKYAIKVTQHNYPKTIQMGDINNWKTWDIDWSKIDLLMGGSPCFVADTQIVCKDGIKNIQDVKVGDMVMTHKLRYKKVIKVGHDLNKDIYEIKSQGGQNVLCTNNHPFYVRNKYRQWDKIEKKSKVSYTNPEWKEAGNLIKGDLVGTPICQDNTNKYNLSKEDCFILGMYLGDGHTRKDCRNCENRPNDRYWQLILSLSTTKVDIFKKYVKNINYSCYQHTKNVYRVVLNNKRLVMLAEELIGSYSHSKRISLDILNLPTDELEMFLLGYEITDGSKRKNEVRISTVSKYLINDLVLLIAKLYKTTCSVEFTKKPPTHIIEGRVVNQSDVWTISYRKYHTKQSRAIVADNIVWNPIKSIVSLGYTDTVYNIEVEDDNSYIANNRIVHNCQGFSFSGKGLAFDDPRSKLFFVFCDILNHVKKHNPYVYFLLENVVMKKQHENVITEYVGVDPILINSSLVSAQNRKRLYWTNIPNVTQPEDKGITWGDIRERGVIEQNFYYTESALQWLGRASRKKNKILHIHQDNEKMQMLEASHCKKYSNQRFFGIVDLPTDEQAVASMRGRFLIDGKRQDGKQSTKGLTKQYIEFRYDGKTNALTTVGKDNIVVPFTLPNRISVDEFFFRYITPLECERLQTVNDNYTAIVSNTQRYKMLGNGWTVDVIVHILNHINK